MAKLGRNSSCPCGSGKKYKHCCLGKHEAALRAAESYEPIEEANVNVAELREQYDRLSDYEKAGTIGTSSEAFVKFSDIYVKNKLLSLKDLSDLQYALRAIFLRMHMQMQTMAMLPSPAHYQATTMIARPPLPAPLRHRA
jgi:hypothetical protein